MDLRTNKIFKKNHLGMINFRTNNSFLLYVLNRKLYRTKSEFDHTGHALN